MGAGTRGEIKMSGIGKMVGCAPRTKYESVHRMHPTIRRSHDEQRQH